MNLRCFGDLPISSTQNNIRVTSDQKIEGDKRHLNEKKVDFDTEAIKSLNTKRTNDSGDPSGKRKSSDNLTIQNHLNTSLNNSKPISRKNW